MGRCGVGRWRQAHVWQWDAFGALVARSGGPRLAQGLRGLQLAREDLRELLLVRLTTHGSIAADLPFDGWCVPRQLDCHARPLAARGWSVQNRLAVPQSRTAAHADDDDQRSQHVLVGVLVVGAKE